jgi:hypothetical protein
VAEGVTYSYWLEEIETGGASNEYGPATAPAQPATVGSTVFVPIAAR